MNRRGLLLGILAAGTAPAIVRAESLMKIVDPYRNWVISGFGLALPKGEGAVLRYDSVQFYEDLGHNNLATTIDAQAYKILMSCRS